MIKHAYAAGAVRAFADLGLTKEARNPFPGEEAHKLLGKLKPSKAPKAQSSLAGPKIHVDEHGRRTIDYGQKFSKQPAPLHEAPKELSEKAREALSVFNHGK